eukprot:TRINITY_DN4398_c0_g1_i3.p1 TRINITY_DN4398_c0_g1~~TRINITY_DN4398_c0_g1_i3.p1  ORF type:complete len:427 (+),score=98.50 TRINITY_DN4398_c0_g1_i3:91-1371(+)
MAEKRVSLGFSLGANSKKAKPTPAKPKLNLFGDDEVKPKTLPPSALLSDEEYKKFVPAPTPVPDLNDQSLTTPVEDTTQKDEEDALEAFMKGVKDDEKKEPKIRRDDLEEDDEMESFLKFRKEKKGHASSTSAPILDDSGHPIDVEDYDSDDPNRKKEVPILPPIDHASIEYPEFNKNFYEEHPDIAKMTEEEVAETRRLLDIRVSGLGSIRPGKTFDHFGFDNDLKRAIIKMGYSEPTPIQKQAIPTALAGRDVIGIAKTGSGKTNAYVWPIIGHVMDQPQLEKGDGPIAIILAPTRELAAQIFSEAKKSAKPYNIKCAAVYGGVSKGSQILSIRNGAEIVVATPGRLIDLIKMKGCKMNRCTFLVIDEADRMFELGFEPQIRSIVGQIRPDRQTMLFSATFKKKIEHCPRSSGVGTVLLLPSYK